ncbi:MAG: hypothetical protein Q9211_004127 [Gyalolechia sp. 1 TL-2023]
MAEAIATLSLVSSIVSLVDISSRCLTRLHEFKSVDTHTPAVCQDILNQLPTLLEIVQKLKARSSGDLLGQTPQAGLTSAVDGCIRQIHKIDRLIEKWTPSGQESHMKRLYKAIGSVHNDRKIMEALGILETYKTTLHMYLTTSIGCSSPKPMASIYALPSRQLTYFVGRQDIFQTISHHLTSTAVNLVGHRVVVLTGMGGQGKTQIALEYCKRSQVSNNFQSIFWIDASSENAVIRSYSNFAENLSNSAIAFPDDKSRISYVKECLGRSSGRWLLVFDNFDRPDRFSNVKEYFPLGNSGALIFTSRHTESERLGLSIAVPGMTEDESSQLLLYRSKKDEVPENLVIAKRIAQKLGYLPLAIDQAGSYLSSRRLPLESFFEHETNRKDVILRHTPALWEYRKRRSDSEIETSMSVFTTFEMSLDQVGDDEERTSIIHFLTLAAFLDNSHIGEGLFRTHLLSMATKLEWTSCLMTDGQWDSYKFQDLVASLQAHSLVESTDLGFPETNLSIHPLIRDWLRLRIPDDQQLHHLREAIQLVTATVGKQRRQGTTLQARRRMIAHIDACMESTREVLSSNYDWAFSYLEESADAFASAYNDHGRFEDAAFLYKSLYSYQTHAGSPHVLRTAMNLANALRNQGHYSHAEELYLRIYTERTRRLGPLHADTLRASEGLAVIHSLQEKFMQADKEYSQILQDLERTNGRSDSDTIRIVEGLANIRRHQSQYMEAEALYERALQERLKSSGPRHPDTLRCVEGLAIVYRHQQRFEESIDLYQRVLANLELACGVDHPDTLRTAFNLSIAYWYQGNDGQADAMAKRAHEGFRALLGLEHIDTRRAAEQLTEIRRNYGYQQPRSMRLQEIPEIFRQHQCQSVPLPKVSKNDKSLRQVQRQRLPEVSENIRIQQQMSPSYQVLEPLGVPNPEFIASSHSDSLPPQSRPLSRDA